MDEKHTCLGPHVGSKRLIAYREGKLPPGEREAIQEHLSLCARCTGLLLELRNFETASAQGETGPESLRQEAWESLARRLPSKMPLVRPPAPGEVPRRRLPRFLVTAAAALLLAMTGLTIWAAFTVQRESQRLEEREATIIALRSTLADTKGQLDAARRQIQDLEKENSHAGREQTAARVRELEARVADLTAALAESRRTSQKGQTVVASRGIEVSIAPRFVLRGQESPGSGLLRGGGTINSVRIAPQADRFTVALSLADRPVHGEYRIELSDRSGEILWSARRPGKSLLGDAGTKVSVNGLVPGIYRLRIEGMRPDRSELLTEYILEVERQQTPE